MIANTENTSRHFATVIGRNIEFLRRRAGLGRNEVAQRMGMSYQQLYKFERGQNRVSAEQIVWLKFYLDADYNEFFAGLY